jgi:hypothetical protein
VSWGPTDRTVGTNSYKLVDKKQPQRVSARETAAAVDATIGDTTHSYFCYIEERAFYGQPEFIVPLALQTGLSTGV